MTYSCLVVEDEVLPRKNLCKKIKQYPSLFSLAGDAKNGYQALEFIQKSQVLPSLVITDIQMPVMDGLALSEHLHTDYPQIKILIVSGYDNFRYAQKAIRYNVSDYILKPITDEILYETLISIKMQLDSLSHSSIMKLDSEPNSQSPRSIVAYIQNYISLHYTEELSLEDLASQFHFSTAYIRKIFKQYTPFTPSQYITHLKINEAKRLLLTKPELNTGTIGKMIGYQDPYYFSRIFEKCIGMYPTVYRQIQGKEADAK